MLSRRNYQLICPEGWLLCQSTKTSKQLLPGTITVFRVPKAPLAMYASKSNRVS